MKVSQITVFLENKQGRLADVTEALAEHDVNIRAASIADTIDYGLLRLIVSDPVRARQALMERGFTASETEVLAVEVEAAEDPARRAPKAEAAPMAGAPRTTMSVITYAR